MAAALALDFADDDSFLGFGRSAGLGLSQGAFTAPPRLKAIFCPIMSAVPFVKGKGFPGRFALVVFHWTRHARHPRAKTVAASGCFGAFCCLLSRDRRLEVATCLTVVGVATLLVESALRVLTLFARPNSSTLRNEDGAAVLSKFVIVYHVAIGDLFQVSVAMQT